jgi:molybdopterin synthase catalytic subunit
MSKPELLAQDADSKYPPSSVAGSVRGRQGDVALLTYDELDEKRATSFVADDGAGATVLFSGTTRNSFQGALIPSPTWESLADL